MIKKKLFFSIAAITCFGPSSLYADESSFGVSLSLNTPITVNVSRNLAFPPIQIGQNADVTVEPSDSTAAVFSATGEAYVTAKASVTEDSIFLKTGTESYEQISVDNWTYGGELDSNGNIAFQGDGAINDMRIGATAHIKSENVPGSYSGQATFRLVYE